MTQIAPIAAPTGSAGGPAGAIARPIPGAGGFRVPPAPGTALSAPVPGDVLSAPAEAAAPATLAGLLALQEAAAPAPRDRAARRHGQVLLGGLAALQRALLGAGGAGAALDHLATLLAAAPPADEPGLAALLDAIALRCRIELARHGGGGT